MIVGVHVEDVADGATCVSVAVVIFGRGVLLSSVLLSLFIVFLTLLFVVFLLMLSLMQSRLLSLLCVCVSL